MKLIRRHDRENLRISLDNVEDPFFAVGDVTRVLGSWQESSIWGLRDLLQEIHEGFPRASLVDGRDVRRKVEQAIECGDWLLVKEPPFSPMSRNRDNQYRHITGYRNPYGDYPLTKPSSAEPTPPPKPTPAESDTPATCNHPDMMEKLAGYIADEMNRNIQSPEVQKMKALNAYDPDAEFEKAPAYPRPERADFHTAAAMKKAQALAIWTERVGQNRPWDHKPKIQELFPGARHKQGRYEYYFDIWSNIHYGYVGTAVGFSESLLFDGAGAEQIVSDTVRKLSDWEQYPGPRRSPGIEGWRAWDDAPDRISIGIGIKLYHQAPNGGITARQIMDEVLAITPEQWGDGAKLHACK